MTKLHAWWSPTHSREVGGAVYEKDGKEVMVVCVDRQYIPSHNMIQQHLIKRFPDIQYIGEVGDFIMPNPLVDWDFLDYMDEYDPYYYDDDLPYNDDYDEIGDDYETINDDYDEMDELMMDGIREGYSEKMQTLMRYKEPLMPDELDELQDKLEKQG